MMQISLFEINSEADLLDISQAGEVLGVSNATIRNWIKTREISYLTQFNHRSRFLDRKQVENLKADIQGGRTVRLNNRANKRNSKSTFIPIEQLSNKSLLPILQSYIELIHKNNLPIQSALFIHGLAVLKRSGLVDYKKSLKILNEVQFKNENIKKVISEWYKAIGSINFSDYQDLIIIDTVFSDDSLGILYQSLLDEGRKSQGGSYYTPHVVIEGIVKELSSQINPNTKVFDPCCGTGQFLISFSNYVTNPQLLWGYDIDPIAAQIAKVNLLISYPQSDFYPNIYIANSLTNNPNGNFDIIATNPPWGYHFSKEDTTNLKRLYPSILSNEAFSYFLIRGLKLLNKNGYLCYVLPEAITKIKQHRDIREILLKDSRIKSIKHLGNVFSRVLSPAITLSIQKGSNKENTIAVIQKDGGKTQPKQDKFKNNINYTFDTSITEKDEKIITKIYNKFVITLKDNADWALGIVTGNNNKFISYTKIDNTEGVLKGSDINKYNFKPTTSFITFKPEEFQQVAPEWKFRAKEKLIYKFISSELSFAYDNRQTLTLNSANILIPKIPDIPVKVVLAVLNSNVSQFLFKKKFNTIKVLKGDLEQLPFPSITKSEVSVMEGIVNDLILNLNYHANENRINELISNLYGLTIEEKQYIENSIRK